MEKSCLTCKWEPDWSEPYGGEFSRRHGACRYPMVFPKMPYVYHVAKSPLIRYSDDSGLPDECETWEPKGGNYAG